MMHITDDAAEALREAIDNAVGELEEYAAAYESNPLVKERVRGNMNRLIAAAQYAGFDIEDVT